MGESTTKFGKIASSAAILFVGTAIGLALGFLLRTSLARLLGPEVYGSIILPYSVMSSTAIVARLGIDDGISRFIPRSDSETRHRSIMYTGFVLALLSSVLLSLVMYFASPQISTLFGMSDQSELFRAFALALPAVSLRSLFVAAFRGFERTFERIVIENVSKHGIVLAFVVLAFFLGFNGEGVALFWAGGLWATTIISFALFLNAPFEVSIDFQLVPKELLVFSVPLALSGIKGLALEYGDIFILGLFLTESQVGIYDSAYTVAKLMIAVFGVFGFLFMPIFSRLDEENREEEMDRFYKVVTKWVLSLTTPLFVILSMYSAEVQSLLFGPSYASGGVPLAILSVGLLVHGGSGVARDALISLGYTKIILAVNLLSTALNIGLNVILVRQFGIVGAATATSATFVLFNFLFVYYLYRLKSIHPLTPKLILPIIPTVGTGVLLRNLFGSVSGLYLILVGVLLVCVQIGSYLWLGVEEEDRDIVGQVGGRIGR